MLWTIVVILLVLWVLGLALKVASGLIHILLVIALVVMSFADQRGGVRAGRPGRSRRTTAGPGPRYGTIQSRVRSSGTSMRGCQRAPRSASDLKIVLAGRHHEERVGRRVSGAAARLVVIAGGIQRDVRVGAALRRAADFERAVAGLEVDDFEVMSVLVGIRHHDEPLGPADVHDAAVTVPGSPARRRCLERP